MSSESSVKEGVAKKEACPLAKRQRIEVTTISDGTRYSGRCTWFDHSKNFGAIENGGDPGNLIFVHGNDVDASMGALQDGDVVE